MNASMAKPTASPIPMPRAASEKTQAVMIPALVLADGWGQTGYNARVRPSTKRIRAGSTTLLSPGTGTNTKTPARRTSVRKKPRTVGMETNSTPIAIQVPENADHINRHLLKHPRHGEDEGAQKGGEPRDCAEGRILNGCQNLNEAHDNSHNETHSQQRSAQDERRQKRLPNNLNHKFGRHA